MKIFFHKGITVIEILLIIAVLGLVLAVALPQFSRTRENQVLQNAVAEVLSSVNKARALTLSSLNSSEYGVRFQADQVIIFKGKVYSAGASDNEAIDIVPPASITNVTLSGVSGSAGDLYFNRLSGSPSQTGTVTIAAGNYSKVITISAAGGVSAN